MKAGPLLIAALLFFACGGVVRSEKIFDEHFGEVSCGRIETITNKEIVLKYGTTPEDKIERMLKFTLGSKVHLRRVKSLSDLKPGDLVELDYQTVDKERVVTDITWTDVDPLAHDSQAVWDDEGADEPVNSENGASEPQKPPW